MKESFALIFRQGRRPLTQEEQKRRMDEVGGWALQHINDGHGLDPRVLDDESRRLGDETSTDTHGDGHVTALNFIDAADFDDAVRLAKTHPGLRYRISRSPQVERPTRAGYSGTAGTFLMESQQGDVGAIEAPASRTISTSRRGQCCGRSTPIRSRP
jgi:hypothetical protein